MKTLLDDDIRIVSESDWRIQDDGRTETKDLIGCNDLGYYFGYLDGWPDSTPVWNDEPFSTPEAAKRGRWEHEERISLLDEQEDLSSLSEAQRNEVADVCF